MTKCLGCSEIFPHLETDNPDGHCHKCQKYHNATSVPERDAIDVSHLINKFQLVTKILSKNMKQCKCCGVVYPYMWTETCLDCREWLDTPLSMSQIAGKGGKLDAQYHLVFSYLFDKGTIPAPLQLPVASK